MLFLIFLFLPFEEEEEDGEELRLERVHLQPSTFSLARTQHACDQDRQWTLKTLVCTSGKNLFDVDGEKRHVPCVRERNTTRRVFESEWAGRACQSGQKKRLLLHKP